MEMILGYLHSGFSVVVPFVVLLGILIFVHELGHFLVARWCGVRVEVFSLGFGKKILKYKKGDTTYALSIIPLGGYVKMFGEQP
ncbi:MAG: site-2 protease family protein, partial [Bdellovibrio sp.]|nr:site-2 protease family protein [Bdellovibrio sp.]